MVVSLKKTGFSLGEVEAVLARLYRIDATKRATFSSRLQQLQRMGLPVGANPGRGVKFRYANWQLAEWMLLLDLSDAGVPPSLLKTHFGDPGFFSAAGLGQIVEGHPANVAEGLYLFAELRTLNYLRSSDAASIGEHAADHVLKVRSGLRPVVGGGSTADGDDLTGPAIMINLSRRLADLRAAIDAVMPGHIEGPLFPAEQPRAGMIA